MFELAWSIAGAKSSRKAIIGTCAAAGFLACAKRSYDEQSAYVEAVEAVSMRPAMVRLADSVTLQTWADMADQRSGVAREDQVVMPCMFLVDRFTGKRAYPQPTDRNPDGSLQVPLVDPSIPTVMDLSPKPPNPIWWMTIIGIPCMMGKKVGKSLAREPRGCLSPWILRAAKVDPVLGAYVSRFGIPETILTSEDLDKIPHFDRLYALQL
jgi:hypothetical protein